MSANLFISRNPFNSELYHNYDAYSDKLVADKIIKSEKVFEHWKNTEIIKRINILLNLAKLLEDNSKHAAEMITEEMGKPITQSKAEVKKCANLCRFYAENSESFLKERTYNQIGRNIKIAYEPLGIILGIMPWNFPFWQVFRFAVPAIISANTVLVKHAENVPRCALMIEELLIKSGFEHGIYTNLFISHKQLASLISDKRIKGVALTGSEKAGSLVSSMASAKIKPTVLELGGSDPFIVCEDADIESSVKVGINSRMQNTGQSCIAAKRFIVNKKIYSRFKELFVDSVRQLKTGNPMENDVFIGPMAREDLLIQLEKQLNQSVNMGAKILCGGKKIKGPGNFYQATVVEEITAKMPLYYEEVFGPVASFFVVENDEEAIRLANDTRYGLAASVWSKDIDRALKIGKQIECGSLFINEMVKSDPAFPFGGTKNSGYGRELGEEGLKSFVNIKTYNF